MPPARLLRRWLRRGPAIWYHDEYRPPLPSIEARTGMQPRRAAWAMEWLLAEGVIAPTRVRSPGLASWAELARVHGEAWLEALTHSSALAEVYALDPAETPTDALLSTLRRAIAGTIAAGREAVSTQRPALNLLGGFHHAAPGHGGGFCAANDVAIAIAALRADGFRERIAVLDLDAHQPDGTAACLLPGGREGALGPVWMGSISGTSFGALAGVDEVVLRDAEDGPYLAALDGMLARAPACALWFVLAGGDVLAGDPLGAMKLTEKGVRERDRRVHAAAARASVWLPAGGYTDRAWRVLAGTALVLAGEPDTPIPEAYDPLAAGFGSIFRSIPPATLGSDHLDLGDLGLGPGRAEGPVRLLGFYTAAGVEYGLERYGILSELRRLGYDHFRVALDRTDIGDRSRLYGSARGQEHLLVEGVYAREELPPGSRNHVLFVHWLTMRHPLGALGRPPLPGQEVPGLGMAREAGAMLARMAARLGLRGVAFRPAWYHVAFAARTRMRFVDAGRQGRFEALIRDTAGLPLLDVTRAVAEGRVTMNGAVYTWEPEPMVEWLSSPGDDAAAVTAAREAARFVVVGSTAPLPRSRTP